MDRKTRLQALVTRFDDLYKKGALDTSSEETARSWIEDLLEIFGWDPRNPLELDQEFTLGQKEKVKLNEIDTNHERPDYVFKRGKQNLSYVDAKKIGVNLKTSAKSAFQIRAYGWSSDLGCSFVTNFKEFAIYDCRYKPHVDQAVDVALVDYFTYEEYLNKFEVLHNHLSKEEVLRGNLDELYPKEKKLSGTKSLNEDFCDLLMEHRKVLANHIYLRNKELFGDNVTFLSMVVQVIINRIIFIRICEGKSIEEEGLLKKLMLSGQFWAEFKKLSNTVFYEHYDGPLFKINEVLSKLDIGGDAIDHFIEQLYYPHPYKFDLIPIDLLSNVYDNLLSRVLILEDGLIVDDYNKVHQQIQGAVTTPHYIVNKICNETILPKINGCNLKEVLALKILDPACGSGTFLIEAFNLLSSYLLRFFNDNKDQLTRDELNLFIQHEGELFISAELKRMIINNCLYGVDIDPVAVEVARMSLSLKIFEDDTVDGNISSKVGLYERHLLKGIGDNIAVGNALVNKEIFNLEDGLIIDRKRLEKILPFNWEERFASVFEENRGFDVIVGNPPYIEVKHYKETLPEMHRFIREKYTTSADHKVDIAIPFIEKAIGLLNEAGRMGFIVQKRFFKTEYGMNIRRLLDSKKVIETIIDFGSQSIFPGRITYTAILVLNNQGNNELDYYRIDNLNEIINKLNSVGKSHIRKTQRQFNLLHEKFETGTLGATSWNLEKKVILDLKNKLAKKFGTIGDHRKIELHVGLQVLWVRAYHIAPLQPPTQRGAIIKGITRIVNAPFDIEREACCNLSCNVNFYPFKELTEDMYAIFPYEQVSGNMQRIPFSVFKDRYPLAGKYLEDNKELIQDSVATREGDYWHTFTRENNHNCQSDPKVIIPMTVKDAVAAVDSEGRFYIDNANHTALQCGVGGVRMLYSIAAVINSTVFAALARLVSNPQSNDYIKINKQFLKLIPFPFESIRESEEVQERLHSLSMGIATRQQDLLSCHDENTIPVLKMSLARYWEELDHLVEDLYELTDDEKDIIRNEGRRIDRTNIR